MHDIVTSNHEALYQAVFSNLRLGMMIYVFDNPDDLTTLRIVTGNKAASRFTGFDFTTHQNKRLSESYPNDQYSSLYPLYAQAVRTGKTIDVDEGQFELPNPETGHSTTIYVAIQIVPLPDQHVMVVLDDITSRKAADHALMQAQLQEEIIRAQEAALAELSTPLLALGDGVVVMPLVGTIDSRRTAQVMDRLLTGVSSMRANAVILDITGIPLVDTQVANAFLHAAQAVKLLGAKVILTGIRPEVAQTLVSLGVDLSGITTRATLQTGILEAMRMN